MEEQFMIGDAKNAWSSLNIMMGREARKQHCLPTRQCCIYIYDQCVALINSEKNCFVEILIITEISTTILTTRMGCRNVNQHRAHPQEKNCAQSEAP